MCEAVFTPPSLFFFFPWTRRLGFHKARTFKGSHLTLLSRFSPPFSPLSPFCSGSPRASPVCDCEFNECWCLYTWRVLHNKNVSVKLSMWGNWFCLKMHQVPCSRVDTQTRARARIGTIACRALSDLTRQNSLRLKTYFQLTPKVSIREPPITAERYPPPPACHICIWLERSVEMRAFWRCSKIHSVLPDQGWWGAGSVCVGGAGMVMWSQRF